MGRIGFLHPVTRDQVLEALNASDTYRVELGWLQVAWNPAGPAVTLAPINFTGPCVVTYRRTSDGNVIATLS